MQQTQTGKPTKKQPLHRSFRSAFKGLGHGLKERNFVIHVFFAIAAIALSFYLKISTMEEIVVILMIALVLGAELLNTAIEKSLDFITTDHHPEIAIIKELMSGMVLVFAIAAALVGILIFGRAIAAL